MLIRVREIVQRFSGYQLASDEGVFRFRTAENAEKAADSIRRELKRKVFVTKDIIVISYDYVLPPKEIPGDRFNQEHSGDEEPTNKRLEGCILRPTARRDY